MSDGFELSKDEIAALLSKGNVLAEIGKMSLKPRPLLSQPSLNNAWYAVAFSSQLPRIDGKNVNKKKKKKAGKVLYIQLFGEPIVLYRSSNNKVVACQDRCPHRSAALSMGFVNENNNLVCRYHEWSFDNDGKCINIPNGSKLYTLPCHECDDFIWVYYSTENQNGLTHKNKKEKEKADINDILRFPGEYSFEVVCDCDGNWIHHWENVLDLGHVYFIHKNRGQFGGWNYDTNHPKTVKYYRDNRGYLFIGEFAHGPNEPTRTVYIRFDPPCTWTLAEGWVNFHSFIVMQILPINKQHTRIFHRMYFYHNMHSTSVKLFHLMIKYLPAAKEYFKLDLYQLFNEDNMLIAGQSIRVDYLNAPIIHYSRSEDITLKYFYQWILKAINYDIKHSRNNSIWFNGWNNINNVGICKQLNPFISNVVSSGKNNNNNNNNGNVMDIEDIMSEVVLVDTPFGKFSTQACIKEYPPSNKIKEKEEKLVFKIKLVCSFLIIFVFVVFVCLQFVSWELGVLWVWNNIFQSCLAK